MKEKIIAAYEKLAERYSALIEYKPHNAYYDRPNTLSLFPDVTNRKVLDAACGPGKYAEILISKGAVVKGFDISPKMVDQAQQRNNNTQDFFVHDMEQPLHSFTNENFDIVLCALGLDYIENWEPTIQEFGRVLKPGGYFIFSISHPFFDYHFFKAKNYFTKEAVKCTWKGFGVPVEINNYRRSLTDCLQPLTDNGFYVDKLLEPRPIPEFEKYDARHFKELNEFPSFLCIRARKK